MDARVWRNVALSLLVSGIFLYLAFRNVPLAELGEALGRVRAGWLFSAVLVSFLIMVFRAWRWQLELLPLERIPFGRLWVITAVAYMAINLLPARLGEVVRPWLLSRRSSVSFSNVVGNLVVEKTMDSVVILFYILVGLLTVENLPAWVRTRRDVSRRRRRHAGGAGACCCGGAARRSSIAGCSATCPSASARGVKRMLGAIVAGMQVLPNPRLLLAVFLVSLALWFLPILSSYIMIRAFDFARPVQRRGGRLHLHRLRHRAAQRAGHDRPLSVRLHAGAGPVRRRRRSTRSPTDWC